MIRLSSLRWFLGQAAALIFAAMVLVNQVEIAPAAGEKTLPQTNLWGYTDASLSELALELDTQYPTYRANIAYLDSLFILCFAGFVAVMLWRVMPRVGVTLAVAYALADLAENRLILRQTDLPFSAAGWQPALPVDTGASLAYWFTLAKVALFGLCLVMILFAGWKERK